MSQEKKISFGAVDNGILSLMDKIKSKNKELASDMMREARQYSQSGKEQVKYIEDQIKAIERRNKIDAEGRQITAQGRFEASKGGSKAEATYKKELSTIDKESKEDQLQTKLLRELIETVKLTAKDEIREDKKNVENQLKQPGFFGKMFGKGKDDETNLKESIQKDLLKEKKESETSKLSSYAKGGVNAALNPAGALAGIGMIGGALAYMYTQGMQLRTGGKAFSAKTGVDYMGVGNPKLGIGDAAAFGVSRNEHIEYAGNLASTRGYSTQGFDASGRQFASDVASEALKLMATEKGFGLQSGFTSGLSRYQQFDTNDEETSGDIQNFVKIMKNEGLFKGGDFSRMADLLEVSNQIAGSQSATLEEINSDVNADIIAQFQRVGGSYKDSRAGQRIASINDALINPNNDFKQAFAYAQLRKINPNASFFELQEMQSKGLAQDKYLSYSMKSIKDMSGNDKNMQYQSTMSMLGTSPEQARSIVDAFNKNNSIFDRGKIKNILSTMPGFDPIDRATSGTTGHISGRINDVASDLGAKGLNFTGDQLERVMKIGPSAYMSEIGSSIKDAFIDSAKSIASDIGDAISKQFEGLSKKIIDNLTFFPK